MNNFQYVAFLRGINVGGHSRIKMADLREVFETMRFQNVRTLLASGNVIFESEKTNEKELTEKIESGLKKEFNRDISVILRSLDYIKSLQSTEPFEGIEVTKNIRLYLTFLAQKNKAKTLTIPYTSPHNEFTILQSTPMEIISYVDLSKGKGTSELMNFLEKEYGPNVTTRSWATILKVLK
jgi:uncharacterized protein (DUF1697 family)